MSKAILGSIATIIGLSACTLEPLDDALANNADPLSVNICDHTELCDNGILDNGETGVDCGGPCDPCGANNPCACDSDCASGVCVPTVVKINEMPGRCWGESFGGCAQIEYKASAVKAMCEKRELAMCQRAANSQMQMHCVAPAVDGHPWDANVLCCDPEFL